MLAQHAVDAQADPVELLERLEVDIGRAQVDRVHQDLVEELDDRRVFDVVGVRRHLGRRVVGEFDVLLVAGQVLQALLGALAEQRQQRQQGVVRHDHRLDRRLALELDLVQRLGVGRVRDGDRHLVAALGQRDHPLRLHQLVVDDLRRQQRDVERLQVEDRVAERFGAEHGQRARIDQAGRDQAVDELHLVGDRLLLQRIGLRRRQPSCLRQRAGQTRHWGAGSRVRNHCCHMRAKLGGILNGTSPCQHGLLQRNCIWIMPSGIIFVKG